MGITLTEKVLLHQPSEVECRVCSIALWCLAWTLLCRLLLLMLLMLWRLFLSILSLSRALSWGLSGLLLLMRLWRTHCCLAACCAAFSPVSVVCRPSMCHQSVEDEAEDIERRWKVESGKLEFSSAFNNRYRLHYTLCTTLHYAPWGNGQWTGGYEPGGYRPAHIYD